MQLFSNFSTFYYYLSNFFFIQVSATDIDEGPNGRVRYSIFLGDENRDFSISEDTGVVRVAKNLNFERKSRYLLTVRAEDSSNDYEDNVRYDTATISIIVRDINDNPPTFLDSPYFAYVMENTVPPPDGYFLTVRASDADTPQYNGQIRYFLKEGDAGVFRINASTGDISLLRALDRETQSEYLLTLVAMDTGKSLSTFLTFFFFLPTRHFNIYLSNYYTLLFLHFVINVISGIARLKKKAENNQHRLRG